MITQKQLAEFHQVTDRTVRRWSVDETWQKTVQMNADVTPREWALIGEIMQLAYLYNATGWQGAITKRWCSLSLNSFELTIVFYASENFGECEKITFANTTACEDMQALIDKLKRIVYGE